MRNGVFALGLLSMLVVAAAARGAETLQHLRFGDRDRTYLVHVPPGLSGPVPLVVALHGGGGNATATAKMTGLNAEADAGGFIVVYPNGTDRSRPLINLIGKPGFLTWNAGNCCGYAQEHHVDDVGFIRAVVDQLESRYRIDRKRIYATGISNGAMMAYTLGCEASDVFAAVGIVSGIIADSDCKPAYPVAVIDFHGTADQNVAINGGVGSKAFIKDNRPPVQDSIDFWVQADGCTAAPQKTRMASLEINSYGGCRDGTAVTYYIIEGGGHAWPGGNRLSHLLDAPSQAINATDVMWKFFAAHPKR
jgi:polyhydroxybutyrate depolymerase